ncbi:hypothetical protein SO694_00022123 [Aureococcus anophagefferens]|uniref:UBA domain-containing protein n=1 Tax=Aureococcus anophagefferens TaxID=44056 RepID=A0ABR1FT69_AURAN
MASSLKKMLLLALATSQALRLPRLPVAKAPKAKRRALRAAAVASASLAQRAVASTVEAALPAAEVAAEATLVVARGPSPLLNAVRGLATAVFAFSIVNAVRRSSRSAASLQARWSSFATAPPSTVTLEPPKPVAVAPAAVEAAKAVERARRAPPPRRARAKKKRASHYDFGAGGDGRARDHEATAIPGAGLAGAWAAQCAATGCVSHYDFGVRDGARARAPDGAEALARVAWRRRARAPAAMVAGLDKAEAAATFANVVNAVLVALVDAAVPSLKRSDAESLPPLQKVVALTAAAGGVFEELGLVEYAGTPVVYEGRASKSQLQSLFSRYAAAGVAAGLSEDGDATAAAADVAMVDTLQAIFAISDKQADRLAQQVVTKLVQQMMEQAQAEDPEGLLEALAGASGPGGMPGMPGMPDPADVEGQMAALQQLVDSGQLGDDDKREIKKMFAEQLGGGDVDEAIRQANANKDQLDPQARQALDLLNKLCL